MVKAKHGVRVILAGLCSIAAFLPAANALEGAQVGSGQTDKPLTSQDQDMRNRNSVPATFSTEIIAVDAEGRAHAEMVIKVYELLSSGASIEEMRPYVRDDYIQHSPSLPDGPQGVTMFFAGLVAQYPVAIDVHRIIVVGDWVWAHVNFRNLDTTAPDDLGMAAVDIYKLDSDGKLAEHWDAVQGVPTHSVNPNGMFLTIRKGN